MFYFAWLLAPCGLAQAATGLYQQLSRLSFLKQEVLSSHLVSFRFLFSHLPGNMVFLIYKIHSKDFLYAVLIFKGADSFPLLSDY